MAATSTGLPRHSPSPPLEITLACSRCPVRHFPSSRSLQLGPQPLWRGTAAPDTATTRLHGFAGSRGPGDFLQLASSYVVNISVDRNGPGNQRVVANAPHVGDSSRIILHRGPINELTLRRSGAFPDIAKAVGREFCGLEATGKKIPHHQEDATEPEERDSD